MKIHTSHDYPPIPIRTMDWSAIDADTYDASYEGEDESGHYWKSSPCGHGATEFEAILDLLTQLEEKRVGWPDMLDYTTSPQPQRANGEQVTPGLATLLACSSNCFRCKRVLIPGELYADGFRDGYIFCHACKRDDFERSFVEAEESIQ